MEKEFRKTCRRYDVPGDVHFITFSCFQRQAFLARDRARGWFLEALRGAIERHDFAVWAWVIMPEHVHLLVRPRRKEYRISGFLKTLKEPVTRAALRFVRSRVPGFLERMRDVQPNGKFSHRFWQRGGGFDTNLWTRRVIAEKIGYIHRNPVKRGLVARVEDWEWSSMRDFAGLREVALVPLEREAWGWLW